MSDRGTGSRPVVISLPTADRRTAFDFYHGGLGLEAMGDPAEDGIPEPLQLVLNEGVRLMLVPAGGFAWVIGGRQVATKGTAECVVGLALETAADVDELLARAASAGGVVVTEPGQQPWGYAGTFADPDGHLWMLTSA